MATNLKVGKTIDAFAHLTTPFTPQNPFAPWGVSPQAKRLLFLLKKNIPQNSLQDIFLISPLRSTCRSRAESRGPCRTGRDRSSRWASG